MAYEACAVPDFLVEPYSSVGALEALAVLERQHVEPQGLGSLALGVVVQLEVTLLAPHPA